MAASSRAATGRDDLGRGVADDEVPAVDRKRHVVGHTSAGGDDDDPADTTNSRARRLRRLYEEWTAS